MKLIRDGINYLSRELKNKQEFILHEPVMCSPYKNGTLVMAVAYKNGTLVMAIAYKNCKVLIMLNAFSFLNNISVETFHITVFDPISVQYTWAIENVKESVLISIKKISFSIE